MQITVTIVEIADGETKQTWSIGWTYRDRTRDHGGNREVDKKRVYKATKTILN